MSGKKSKRKTGTGSGTIALNKRARYEYELDEKFEAGLVLEGWEVKSLREGRAQITDAYVLLKNGEAWLLGARFDALTSTSTHIVADPQRTRKLLLNAREIARIFAAVQKKGQACVATALYWKGNRIKLEIALGVGKKQHDKRETVKDADWKRQQARLMKSHN